MFEHIVLELDETPVEIFNLPATKGKVEISIKNLSDSGTIYIGYNDVSNSNSILQVGPMGSDELRTRHDEMLYLCADPGTTVEILALAN